MEDYWPIGVEQEERPRLGFDRLSEKLGPRGKTFSREERIIAAEFKKAVEGDDLALEKALRRYAAHLVEYLRAIKKPAKTRLRENLSPKNVDRALLLLGIASSQKASDEECLTYDLPPLLLESWAVSAARGRAEENGCIDGLGRFVAPDCIPPSSRDLFD